MKILIQTDLNYIATFVRIVAGVIIFPYGMQKLFGWFEGPGIKGTLEQMTTKRIPKFIGWLVIMGQSFGSTALLIGFLGRIAAAGLLIIFTGAMVVHLPDGWSMNCSGRRVEKGSSISSCFCRCS